MIVKVKNAGLILFIITISLSLLIAYYYISRMNYQEVDATIVQVGTEHGNYTKEVDSYIVLEYRYNDVLTKGKLYVSSLKNYKIGDKKEIRVNPDDPTKIDDQSLYIYIVPFLIIVLIFDILYIFKGKKNINEDN